MAELIEHDEEEFTSSKTGATVLKLVKQLQPHWLWAAGFLSAAMVVAVTESYSTFLGKRIIDEGIVARDTSALTDLLVQYGVLILVQLLASQNRYRIMSAIAVGNFLLKAALNPLLAARMGAAGIMLATSLMYLLSFACYLLVALRKAETKEAD